MCRWIRDGVIKAPPAWILNVPEVFQHLRHVWEAFWMLSSSRPIGFSGVAPIPFTDTLAYMNWQRVPEGDQEKFLKLIREMDLEYIAQVNPPPSK